MRVQLTGLLLLVPPKRPDKGPTRVFIPQYSGHAALFGFGYDPAKPPDHVKELCQQGANAPDGAQKAGMCYVDLEDWTVDPLGETPAATEWTNFQELGVLNVTRGSGNVHKADPGAIQPLVHGTVVFNRGAAKEGCSLAIWGYASFSDGPLVRPLANVVPWEMSVPETLKLTFTRKDSTMAVSVPIIKDADDSVELILANIPYGEVKNLPPATGGRPTGYPGLARHFAAFYDLLSSPATGSRPTLRPLPIGRIPIGSAACDVGISTLSKTPQRSHGVRTYACMPAAAELGP